MIDSALHSYSSYMGARLNHLADFDSPHFDITQPRIKTVLLRNYDWVIDTYIRMEE